MIVMTVMTGITGITGITSITGNTLIKKMRLQYTPYKKMNVVCNLLHK